MVQLLHRAAGKLLEIIPKALKLHHQRQPRALKHVEHFPQLRDGLLRPGQVIFAQLRRGQILHIACLAGHTAEIRVVEHGQRPVGKQVHVQLRAEAVFHRTAKRRERILRRAERVIVQPAVGVAIALQHRPLFVVSPPAQQPQACQHRRSRQGDPFFQ